MIKLVLRNFHSVSQGAIASLQQTPTNPSDPTGILGLRLVYFPLIDTVFSLGDEESPPRREG
jgi:hypothetical protein